jgi:hypothetical protein
MLREVALRAMRPYTHHQAELNARLIDAVERNEAQLEAMRERDAERIERLESLVVELIRTAETLRREIADRTAGPDEGEGSLS